MLFRTAFFPSVGYRSRWLFQRGSPRFSMVKPYSLPPLLRTGFGEGPAAERRRDALLTSQILLMAARSRQHGQHSAINGPFSQKISLRKHMVYLPSDPRGQCHQAFPPSVRRITASLHCRVCVLLTEKPCVLGFSYDSTPHLVANFCPC